MAPRRNRLRKNRLGGRRRSIMSTASGPFIVLGAIIVGVIAVAVLFVTLALPPILRLLNLRGDPGVVSDTIEPTPEPIPQTRVEILPGEVVLSHEYISSPFFFEGEVLYSAGRDSAGNPRMYNIYMHKLANSDNKDAEERIEKVQIAYDDLFQVQKNSKFLVWADNKRTGGGEIMAMGTGKEPFSVKKYAMGMPKITLYDGLLFWTERTGSKMDKLFVCDLAAGENAALALFDNSPYGQSDAYAAAGEVVWADKDPNSDNSSLIYSLKLDGNGGQPATYAPGTYVHDPITNGTALAWMDTNHSPNAKLYLCADRGDPKPIMVEEGIMDYALGEDFLVFSKNQIIQIYFWKTDTRSIVTADGENAQLIGVQGDIVSWYQLGQNRDILKYATVRSVSE